MGSSRISNGSIITISTREKIRFFPLNSYMARPYPTSELKNRPIPVCITMMIALDLYQCQYTPSR